MNQFVSFTDYFVCVNVFTPLELMGNYFDETRRKFFGKLEKKVWTSMTATQDTYGLRIRTFWRVEETTA